MSKMIELCPRVFIRPEHIISIEPAANHSDLYPRTRVVTILGRVYFVNERPEVVRQWMERS